MKTKIQTIALVVLFALSFGVDAFQQVKIEQQDQPTSYKQSADISPAHEDGTFEWAVKVVWQKNTRLGGGALPNMDDLDTDADWVIVNSKYLPDSTILMNKIVPPVSGYTLKRIIKARKL